MSMRVHFYRTLIIAALPAAAHLQDPSVVSAQDVPVWGRFEAAFTAARDYDNPLYDVPRFAVHFTSATGRKKTVNAFWDGGRSWKVRFMPDEPGAWTYVTEVKVADMVTLHDLRGTFRATQTANAKFDLYRRGALRHPKGTYYLAHADGTPFFWAACTAWNGALKSTNDEWDRYLSDRVRNGYSVIQLAGCSCRGSSAAFDLDRWNSTYFNRLKAFCRAAEARGVIVELVMFSRMYDEQRWRSSPLHPDNNQQRGVLAFGSLRSLPDRRQCGAARPTEGGRPKNRHRAPEPAQVYPRSLRAE